MFGFSEVRKENLTLKELYENKLKQKILSLDNQIKLNQHAVQRSQELIRNHIDSLKADLDVSSIGDQNDLKKVWLMAKKWVRARQIIPDKATGLSSILNALQHSKIIKSDVSRKGTQLKLLLTLAPSDATATLTTDGFTLVGSEESAVGVQVKDIVR